MEAERRLRVSDVASAAWGYVRRAPGTFVWLAILFVTTVVMHHLSPQVLNDVLGDRSTNLHHLREDPIRVLVTSAFWIAGGTWIGYCLLFTLFHVPVERWLGTWRWLSVAVIAHVGATYISEGVLYLAIQHHRAPESAVNTLDVGVSYALAGVTAVLAYRIAPPWRYVYVVGVLLVYGLPLFGGLTFTDIGHFTAVLIGFGCYPLTRSRPGVWDPADWLRGMRQRVGAHR
ncbi:rhomboid-like protein [Prescottella equi]|uniref:rhomboid-like protein n=1 Tax=Rhodococcus hoagii TaxID=43767 RepID=UPI001C792CD9|nr:rhomboid-like protein [Prescottella equi]BCN78351.1 membrane protein [Prescottella equi]